MGRWAGGWIWFGVADEVENDGGDDTKQTKLLLPAPMPPVPLLPSLPSSIIHHSPDPPFFALSLCLSTCSSLPSVMSDGAEKEGRMNEPLPFSENEGSEGSR